MTKLTSQDTLAKEVADELMSRGREISDVLSDMYLDALKDVISGRLRKGFKVRLSGFGTFEPFTRKARAVRNPFTKEMMTIRTIVVAKFRTGFALKKFLRD